MATGKSVQRPAILTGTFRVAGQRGPASGRIPGRPGGGHQPPPVPDAAIDRWQHDPAEGKRDRAIDYAKERAPFGKPLAANQGIQFPIVELVTQCEMLRAFIRQTAWRMDSYGTFSVSKEVSMCNYWANRLCCEAADRAMQVFGGLGYSRHQPFEHIYRHHRRYRITEGTEEIQMRRVAGYLFGFMDQQAPKGVTGLV